ncbi:MAG: cupredoxin domain-containing protein [Thaumarchaeota archaeon]|nr:cupredoxin domain-containing protein [Nitrososphaerota archaeon]
MTTAEAAVVVLIVIVAGMMITVVGQSDSLNNQLSSIKGQMNTLKDSVDSLLAGGLTGGVTVTPTTRHITLYTYQRDLEVAEGVIYQAWTFNGTVPGPAIFVNQGDTVVFTLINNSTMGHSMDFHAAEIDWATAYSTVAPGGNKTFTFVANYPGVFMYHCGTPPVLQHISNGMYGAIIVLPSTPLPPAPGGSFVLVESEFYMSAGSNGTEVGNYTKMLSANPDYVVFNGQAIQYMKSPLLVLPNQLVRLYLLNVGPSLWEAFHVIGTIMDTVYVDGNPANVQRGLQTVNLAPSNGAIVDMYFRDPGGKNPFVTHAFAYASRGAIGVFQVGGQGGTTTTTTGQQQAGVTVNIPDGAVLNQSSAGYSPTTITVVIGMNSTITWANQDSAPHTVTARDGSFDSHNLDSGESFTYTFTQPGTYHYYCEYHPWMEGTVYVVAMH